MNRLKELRKEKGLSQVAFSKEIGIPLRTLQSWENGESQIKPDKAQVLADFFGVSVGYLLGYTDIQQKYEDEKLYNIDGKVFPFSYKQSEDEKDRRQYKKFIHFLIDTGIFLTNDEIETSFKMLKFLDANNVNNGEKNLITGISSEKWQEYKNGIYSDIINPKSEFRKSDLEAEIDEYIYAETYENSEFSPKKAQKFLHILKDIFGERNYLDDLS